MAKEYTASQVVDSHSTEHKEVAVDNIQGHVVLLTWVVFFIVFFLLTKFAFKPILNALDQREKDIADSIENADRIQKELEELETKKNEIIETARSEAENIVKEARKAAQEAGAHIQKKAKEEAQIILENARRDLNDEVAKAQANLREESAQIAVDLASKLIESNLDENSNQKLIDQFIKNL